MSAYYPRTLPGGYTQILKPTTHETVRIEGASISLVDDFLCGVVDTNKWTEQDTAGATKAISAGILTYHLAGAGATEEGGIYARDSMDFNLDKGVIFEARVAIHVAPTLTAEVFIGLVNDAFGAGSMRILNADECAIYSAFGYYATLGAGLIPAIRTDDAANPSGIISSALTAHVLDAYHIFRIDCLSASSVKFYVDGVRVAGGTTFNMFNGTNIGVQPMILVQKNGAGADLGDIYCDYIKCFQLAR